MDSLRLLVLIVTLPMLLGGCGEKESVAEVEPVEEKVLEVKPEKPVAETEPELEGVNIKELEERQGIMHLKGSDTPYTGKVYGSGENGQKKAEANFKDGKLDGLWVWRYGNGQKESELNYKDGKEDGLWTQWHENGQKQREVNFKDGKEDGLYVAWYDTGEKELEYNFKDGKQDRLWLIWHKNGQKAAESNWKDGEMLSEKYWNSKGEPVDTIEEARK